MKKVQALTLAALALFLTACGGKTEKTTSDEQTVAEKQGALYAVNLQTSKVDWKAFHKGGFAPRWGTLNIQSGEVIFGVRRPS